MTIAEAREKCKVSIAKIPRDMLIIAVLVLSSSASFGLGFLAGRDTGQGSQMTLQELPLTAPLSTESVVQTGQQVVASKNGTKYYFPGCTGADRISEANKITFISSAAAMAAGYTLAVNCKEL